MAKQADTVDGIVEQWRTVRPHLDSSPIHIVGRVSRLARLMERRLSENFAEHGLEQWMYDVMATLRRGGPPYELTAGQLVHQSMVTTGAITNRIDRLAARGLVERRQGTDRRTVIVRLTPAGVSTVDTVAVSHLATERALLEPLSAVQRNQLANLLRQLLVHLDDTPTQD